MRVSFVRCFAIAAVAALALAACGSSSKSSSATTATTVAPTTVPSTQAPVTTAGGGAASSTTVALAQNSKIGKAILVDSKGMTLYISDKDPTGQSACDSNATCAQAWPAYYVTGTPTAGTGLNQAMFTTITAPNGQKQLAVNGKPLYYWFQDKAAGDATGQDVNDFYVVGANGQKIDES
jgi:predicted lipoprotein with Yx(FWY)xxD motif